MKLLQSESQYVKRGLPLSDLLYRSPRTDSSRSSRKSNTQISKMVRFLQRLLRLFGEQASLLSEASYKKMLPKHFFPTFANTLLVIPSRDSPQMQTKR
jgi:hypothetical protein